MGRSPQIIEDQVTYPLVSNLQGIPKVKNVRGTSMFGMSFVYIVFEDKADVYWARSRVLERLNYAQRLLPQGITPTLGPDGTGVGHILWYTLDAKGMNLGEQRALQDWYVKLGLQTVPGVSEVASFGGFEMNGTGYVVRGLGYIKAIQDVEDIPVGVIKTIPVTIKDIATVQMGGDERLGIFDRNGDGEAVGGIVVMRYGENADQVIQSVKAKMADIQRGLPAGVSFNIAYDRSELIENAIGSIKHTLIEEMIVVSLIVILFLFSWRSALSIIIQIPITIAASFILLNAFGISSNIMSLTGIALAIGVIVDNGIVMVENAHRNLSIAQQKEKS
jgi:Cu/Ag efflux pump CusA